MKQLQLKLDACEEENKNLKLQLNKITKEVAVLRSDNADLKADNAELKADCAELKEFMRVYHAKVRLFYDLEICQI